MYKKETFNAENPMFFSFVEMFRALIEEGIIKTAPESNSTLLLYKTNLSTEVTQGTPLEGKTEGWVAENIFSVAQCLFEHIDERMSLYTTLKEQGIIPTFNEDGTFKCLTKRAVPKFHIIGEFYQKAAVNSAAFLFSLAN